MGRKISMVGEWWSNMFSGYAAGDYPWRDWLGSRIAIAITLPIAIVCVGGFMWAVLVWPLWLGFLVGVPLLALGVLTTFWAVSKSMLDGKGKSR
jgi:hypothetical protein